MSAYIQQELYFSLHSIALGVLITFSYDWIRIARRVVKHNLLFISIEDFLFWVICSIRIFLMLYQENNGILRWFAVIGALIGMFFYKLLIGRFFVTYTTWIVKKILHVIGKLILFMIKPFKKARKYIGSKSKCITRRIARVIKKKLTMFIKMVKIVLCKQ